MCQTNLYITYSLESKPAVTVKPWTALILPQTGQYLRPADFLFFNRHNKTEAEKHFLALSAGKLLFLWPSLTRLRTTDKNSSATAFEHNETLSVCCRQPETLSWSINNWFLYSKHHKSWSGEAFSKAVICDVCVIQLQLSPQNLFKSAFNF